MGDPARGVNVLESAAVKREGEDGMEVELIEPGTRVTGKMDGVAREIGASRTRTFMVTLEIIDQIEQEALDVSIWGSADGEGWGNMPLLKMPQRFYRGATRQVLDLTFKPEVQFLRARCEPIRWGRVAPTPMFVCAVKVDEIPAFPQAMGIPTASGVAG
jgi:hypothetical protein